LKALRIIGALILVLVAAALLVWFVYSVLHWFFGLPPGSMAPVAGVIGVLLVPIITFFTTRALQRRRSLEDALREHKTALYDELIKGLLKMLNLGGVSAKMTDAEMKELFASVTPPLITYGSRGVILAWNGFRQAAKDHGDDNKVILFAFEDLLKSMRKDLGHSVLSVQKGELLRIFVNDVDTIL